MISHGIPHASDSLRIYFVRHGETAWSLSGQYAGVSDVPLTPRGEAMARELASPLATVPFTQVLTSPRLRARSTCQLAGLNSEAEVDPDLAEWNYGEYESLRAAEIRHLHPNWDVWRDPCPGGETAAQVFERADRLIGRLRHACGSVALFSHGQFGRVLAARWIGLDGVAGRHFVLEPTSVSILSVDANDPTQRVISLWNWTSTAAIAAT